MARYSIQYFLSYPGINLAVTLIMMNLRMLRNSNAKAFQICSVQRSKRGREKKTISALLAYLAISVFLYSHHSVAAVINAASASRVDVGTAVASASDGDTVVIPIGTAQWSTSLTITKAITVQGAGIGLTIIQDDIPLEAIPQELLRITLVPGKLTRITGIQFNPGSRPAAVTPGTIHVWGSNEDGRRIRIDHCHFNGLLNTAMYFDDCLGVVDHNVVLTNVGIGFAHVRNRRWNGRDYGDGSWSDADRFGSEQFLFFEDNTVTYTGAAKNDGAVDADGGARYVSRYNTYTKCSLQSHGTESPGRLRGARAIEVYNDTFIGDNNGQQVTYFRSGTGVIHDIAITGFQGTNTPLKLLNFRNNDAFAPWGKAGVEAGGADGQNPWDANAPGGPFATGTVAGYSIVGKEAVVTVAGSPWTVNQWAGYSITRTSGKSVTSLTRSGSMVTAVCPAHGFTTGNYVCIRGAVPQVYNFSGTVTAIDADRFTYTLNYNAGTPATPATGTIIAFRGASFSEINSSTASSIAFKQSVYSGRTLTFAPGDRFAVWKVDHAMDQCGRAGGSLVSGSIPSRPGGWNDQVTSPWYAWNNTRDGGTSIGFAPSHATIRENEHYFNDIAKPGYTPYTYPHPLVVGSADVLSGVTPPGNLRVIPAP